MFFPVLQWFFSWGPCYQLVSMGYLKSGNPSGRFMTGLNWAEPLFLCHTNFSTHRQSLILLTCFSAQKKKEIKKVNVFFHAGTWKCWVELHVTSTLSAELTCLLDARVPLGLMSLTSWACATWSTHLSSRSCDFSTSTFQLILGIYNYVHGFRTCKPHLFLAFKGDCNHRSTIYILHFKNRNLRKQFYLLYWKNGLIRLIGTVKTF